jgi:hypothetical protein
LANINNILKDLFGAVLQANEPVDILLLPGKPLISYLIIDV